MKMTLYSHTDIISQLAILLLPVYFIWFIYFVINIYLECFPAKNKNKEAKCR